MGDVSRILVSSLIAIMVYKAQLVYSARILGVFPTPSISHQVIYRALMMELARRGHELVVVTPDPINDPTFPNYTEVDVSFLYDGASDLVKLIAEKTSKKLAYDATTVLFDFVARTGEILLGHESFQALAHPDNTNEHFDLVFLEWFATPCLSALSRRFSAPMIGISSFPQTPVILGFVGNPTNPSYCANKALPYTDKNRTFLQRLDSLIFHLRFSNYIYNHLLPKQYEAARQFFGHLTPPAEKLFSESSMLFMNYVKGFHPPIPNVPSVVFINGFNIKTPKPLPQEIRQFLDSSPKGAIYMSLGSNVKSADLPPEKRSAFLEAFAELSDYHVLWKWEADSLPGQPGNVRTVKWAPQQDVLRHPNVKVFITQGGLQSTEESINASVPMIGIPFCCDQYYNLNLGQDKGISIRLDLNGLTKDTLLRALKKVINDESYAKNIERLSIITSDQPSSPMERAVWWTEYVLRHKGAAHLRTAAVDMPWYSYLLLDVALFLLATALLVAVLCWQATRCAWSLAMRLLVAAHKHKTA